MDNRKTDLAKIHIAKKALNMDDLTYRELLQRVTGQESAGALSEHNRAKVLDEFKRLGWKPAVTTGKRWEYRKPQSRQMIMLWKDLYDMGHVHNKANTAMHNWIKTQTEKAHPDWLEPTEANQLIEALKAWKKRPVKEVS